MTRTVLCRKSGKELGAPETPGLPGFMVEKVFESVSNKAWLAWSRLQTTGYVPQAEAPDEDSVAD